MAVNVKHLVRMFSEQAELIEERVPGYRIELLKQLTAIIEAEQENRVRSLPIQQRVAEECTRLGGKLEDALQVS